MQHYTQKHKRKTQRSQLLAAFITHSRGYQLWDSNPHSEELDFESSASTNSAKLARVGCFIQERGEEVKPKVKGKIAFSLT